MSTRPARLVAFAWTIGSGTLAALIASVIVLWPDTRLAPLDAAWALGQVAFAAVGVLLITRRPHNLVGWALLAFLAFGSLTALLGAVGEELMATNDFLAGRAFLVVPLFQPLQIGAMLLGLLVFPDGRPPSPRWWWSAAPLGLGVLLTWIASFWALWSLSAPELAVIGQGGWPDTGTFWDAVQPLIVAATIAPLVIIDAAALAVRYRSGGPVEKSQIKWPALAVGLLAVQALVRLGADLVGFNAPAVLDWGFVVTVPAIPVTIAIAILRYRLFEIDRLISRTVSYLVVTALAVGLFGLVVVALPASSLGRDSTPSWLVAAATLAAAAAFNPLRRRVQAVVDRRFNRARYDAQLVAESFATRLRKPRDLEIVTADLAGTVAATVQPDRIGLWIRA